MGSRFDGEETIVTDDSLIANSDVADKTETQSDIVMKKCGIPNQMGLNKYGLEFLSSSHSKAGKIQMIKCNFRL